MDHMQCPRVLFFLVIIGVRQIKMEGEHNPKQMFGIVRSWICTNR